MSNRETELSLNDLDRKCFPFTRVFLPGWGHISCIVLQQRQGDTLGEWVAVGSLRSDMLVISFPWQTGGRWGRFTTSWQYQLSVCEELQLQVCPHTLGFYASPWRHFQSLFSPLWDSETNLSAPGGLNIDVSRWNSCLKGNSDIGVSGQF